MGKGSGKRIQNHRACVNAVLRGRHRSGIQGVHKALAELVKTGDNFTPRKVFECDDESEALRHETDTILNYGIDSLLNGVCGPLFGCVSSEKVRAFRRSHAEALREGHRRIREKREHDRIELEAYYARLVKRVENSPKPDHRYLPGTTSDPARLVSMLFCLPS